MGYDYELVYEYFVIVFFLIILIKIVTSVVLKKNPHVDLIVSIITALLLVIFTIAIILERTLIFDLSGGIQSLLLLVAIVALYTMITYQMISKYKSWKGRKNDIKK